jgi:serine/threonine-protein kinase
MKDPSDVVTERAMARVGTTLKDKWTLDKLVGVGGMAAVYSATHRNGIRVAVKILHAELSVSTEIRSRFLREGYVANKVDHPGAVVVLDDEVAEDGAVFLVMELLEGETLAERLERKTQRLAVDEVLLVADQMLDVLTSAHAKNIVHRDIKPDNVFITLSGSIKLLDFGIARLREISAPPSSTRTGALMGTPAYMAPEQARARWDDVDARTDLWSVGATMFKLITGRPVHEAETINEQLLSAMTNPAPSIGTLAPGLSIPVVDVIDRALAFDKADRWPDAPTMQAAVRAAYRAITGRNAEQARLSFLDDESIGADLPTAETHFARSAPSALSGRTPPTLALMAASSERPKRKASKRGGAVGLFGILAMAAAFAVGYFGFRKTPPEQLASLLNLDRADAATENASAPAPARVSEVPADTALAASVERAEPDADAAPDVATGAAAEPFAQAPASAPQARPATTKPKKGPAKKPVVRKHRRK